MGMTPYPQVLESEDAPSVLVIEGQVIKIEQVSLKVAGFKGWHIDLNGKRVKESVAIF